MISRATDSITIWLDHGVSRCVGLRLFDSNKVSNVEGECGTDLSAASLPTHATDCHPRHPTTAER